MCIKGVLPHRSAKRCTDSSRNCRPISVPGCRKYNESLPHQSLVLWQDAHANIPLRHAHRKGEDDSNLA
jgi:hypothetical protein